jgi:antirestriction protein
MSFTKTNQMTLTTTAVPIEIAAELSQKALDYITELVEGTYALEDILQFIKEYNSDDFISYYVDYVEQGERVGYDVVDAFLQENDISDVARVEDAFIGNYDSAAQFAENYYNDIMDVPSALVIDWGETFHQSLGYDYDYVEGYVFQSNF